MEESTNTQETARSPRPERVPARPHRPGPHPHSRGRGGLQGPLPGHPPILCPRRRHGSRTRPGDRRRPLAPQQAAALDNNIFALGLTRPDTITAHHPEIDAAFAKVRIWLGDPKNRTLLSLYEQRIRTRKYKTKAQLDQLQQERREALQQAVEEASLLAQLAASKGEAFDIARDLPRLTHYPQFDFSSPEIARLVVHAQRLAEARRLFQKPPKPLRMAA